MGVAIACETAGGTGVGPAVIRYCFTYGLGAMARVRLAQASSNSVSIQDIIDRRSLPSRSIW
jgi:hypothetical protein